MTFDELVEKNKVLYHNNIATGMSIQHAASFFMQDMKRELFKMVYVHMTQSVPETTEDRKDVHTEHCCVIHGCKYGHRDCPVETGVKRQSYECESCSWEM